ncbi:MAG: 4'-phosphopantetheinyl transferase family protein [Enterobacterales bacterium]|uniref:4'-phosphopantetheinyl transferase family protein n=1 Tax=Serratia sp. (in: enterobacteria) TaxID=616 RepID=UPI003F3DEF1A
MMNYIYCSRIDGLSRERLYSQRNLLDPHQQTTFDQFRFDDDKRRMLLARMLLRYVLTKHEGYQGPHFPHLHYQQFGKPTIMGMKGEFNISHAGVWAVCAYNPLGDIGVDIEKRVPIDIHDYQDVLTPEEFTQLAQGGNVDFFRLWSLKEAIIKADGRGFSLSPTMFTLPHPFANGLTVDVAEKRWYLYSQDIGEEYVLSSASVSNKTALFSLAFDTLLA